MLWDCDAYDLILIQDGDNTPSCSESMISFQQQNGRRSTIIANDNDYADWTVYLLVVGENGEDHRFPVVNNMIQDGTGINGSGGNNEKHSVDALMQIASCLKPGRNQARFLLVDDQDGRILGIAPMNIFLWSADDKVVVVDVDGTITKSTMRGFLCTAIYEDFSDTYCHDGVCEFLASIPNVRFVYLTNRPISYATTTRKFLTELCQDEKHRLPAAPLIGFTGGLAGVFKVIISVVTMWPSSVAIAVLSFLSAFMSSFTSI